MARLSDLPVFPLPLVLLPGRAPAAAHLRAALPRARGALPGGPGAVLRRARGRRRRARGRLPGARSHGARAPRRRPPQHRRERRRAGAARPDRRRGALVPERRGDACSRTTTSSSPRTRWRRRWPPTARCSSEIGRDDAEPLSAQPRLSYALGARIDVGIQVGQALLESRSERRAPRAHHRGARAGRATACASRPSASAGRCATARSSRPSRHLVETRLSGRLWVHRTVG